MRHHDIDPGFGPGIDPGIGFGPPGNAGTRSGRRTGIAAACPVPRNRKKPITQKTKIRTRGRKISDFSVIPAKAGIS